LFKQHDWNIDPPNENTKETTNNTYETITMEKDKAKTLQQIDK